MVWLDDGPTPILYISLMLFISAKLMQFPNICKEERGGFVLKIWYSTVQ